MQCYESTYAMPAIPAAPARLALAPTIMLLGWVLELMRDAMGGSDKARAECKLEAQRTLQCVCVYVSDAESDGRARTYTDNGPVSKYLRRCSVLLATGHEDMACVQLHALRKAWRRTGPATGTTTKQH